MKYEIGKTYRVVDWDKFHPTNLYFRGGKDTFTVYYVSSGCAHDENCHSVATIQELNNGAVVLVEDKLQLEVGKTYEMRNGEQVRIIRETRHITYPFEGEYPRGKMNCWMPSGKFTCFHAGSMLDIVREISQPTQDTNMNTQEAFRTLAADFKARVTPGSTVRIARKWTAEEAEQWGAVYPVHFFNRNSVGDEFVVRSVNSNTGSVSGAKEGMTVPFICLEVVEIKSAFEPIEVDINDDYTAVVHDDYVKVGCLNFNFDAIEELYNAVQKAKDHQ